MMVSFKVAVNYLVFETFGFESIVATVACLDLFQERDPAHGDTDDGQAAWP